MIAAGISKNNMEVLRMKVLVKTKDLSRSEGS